MVSLLCDQEPAYGYFPEPNKCILLVDESCKNKVWDVFYSLGVRVITGHRFLGGFIGSNDDMLTFVSERAGFIAGLTM